MVSYRLVFERLITNKGDKQEYRKKDILSNIVSDCDH